MQLKFFPQKVVKRFIFRQVFFLALLLLVVVLSLRHYVGGKFTGDPHFLTIATELDGFVLQLGWLLLFLGMIYVLWTAYVHFYPLGRLLVKAKNIKRGTYRREWDQEFHSVGDEGEWYELELTLNKIHRDLTKYKSENKRRQIELESLAGAVSDGIIAIDPAKKVQFFNGQMALILGKAFDPLSPPSLLDEVFRAPKLTVAVDEVMTFGQAKRIQIPLRPHKSSESHIYDVVVTPVKSEKKQNYGVIAVFHDITEAKKLEEVRVDFVANASHELKTPITSIKGFSEALQGDLEQGDISGAKDKAKVIFRNIDRLDQLVKDLLDLSRIESGGEALKEEIDVREVTEDILREIQPLLDAKRQKVQTDLQVLSVKANLPMLNQVLSNLLENVVKYGDDGCLVKIQWIPQEDYICLKVADSGPGISEEHLSRLFERFYRVQSGKAKSGVMGTGLGLSIVKNCMWKHRGRVEVESLPGRGTVFTCFFPKNI